jgi:hypothetical protein
MELKKILWPTDFSGNAEEALPKNPFQADLRNQVTWGWRGVIYRLEESLNMLEKAKLLSM